LLIGLPVSAAKTRAWSLGLGAAGLAGVFWVLLFPVTPFMGLKLTVMSILMVMAAGPGHIPLAMGAGFLWGFLESFASAAWGLRWGPLLPLMVFLIFLTLSPQGLAGLGSALGSRRSLIRGLSKNDARVVKGWESPKSKIQSFK
jgi:branched-subunit amino acid ABC-type transport system permease component